jgi:two-component system response regulator RegA
MSEQTFSLSREQRTLLIVDDDGPFRNRLVRAFRERGFDASGAGDYETAMAAARTESPELALVDLRLTGKSRFAGDRIIISGSIAGRPVSL